MERLVAMQESSPQPQDCLVAYPSNMEGMIIPLNVRMVRRHKIVDGEPVIERPLEIGNPCCTHLVDLLRVNLGVHAWGNWKMRCERLRRPLVSAQFNCHI